MKLWLISQDVNDDYDTFDSAVVAAETEEDARRIHPCGDRETKWFDARAAWGWFGSSGYFYSSRNWAGRPEQVRAELIGEAKPNTEAGVICSSFNAG